MEQYNLYIESGNKSLIAVLTDGHPVGESLSVIRENTDSNDDIVNIPISSKLISLRGKSYDEPVFLTNIDIDTNILTATYSGERNEFDLPSNETFFFERNEKKNQIIIRDAAGNGNISEEYTITLKYKSSQSVLKVHCAPKSAIYDVILDFGSEASQMLVNRRDNKILSLKNSIVSNIGKHFFGEEFSEEERYDQQEINDKSLYRSVFFSKTENIDESFISLRPSPEDKSFSFLTKRNSANKGKRLPNIKIAQISNSGGNFSLNQGNQIKLLHRGIILRFLHEAICEIKDQQNLKESNGIFIKFSILVPNVMSQDEVSDLLNDLYSSLINDVIPSYEVLNIQGIEINSVSESDASLMHWINTSKNIKKGQYLIVDMGKGTTDFSVVNILNGGYIESVSRAGFIGAGNALSYAIFDNYMWKLGRHDREILIRKMLKAEPALLYKLEEVIEKYKRNFNPDETNRTISKIESIDEVSANKILDSIKNGGNIGDGASLVLCTIYKIIKEIVIRINGLKFDYIILAGRGFMFKPMFNTFKKIMSAIYPNAKLLEYKVEDAKKGCLLGPLSDVIVSNYSNIVGIPQTINTTDFFENLKDVSDKIDTLRDKSIKKNNKTYKAIFDKIIKNSGEYASLLTKVNERMKLHNSNSVFAFIPTYNSYPTSSNAKVKMLMKEGLKMEKGSSIENYGADTSFFISGNKYVLSNFAHLDIEKDYEIYYDGKTFWIRGDKQCYQLSSDNHRNEDSLLFESLFPYCLEFDKYANIPNNKPISR